MTSAAAGVGGDDGDDGGGRRQLEALLREHRAGRAGVLERDAPLSWTQTLVALVSYALLLSDVLRTGLVPHSDQYLRMEPDRAMSLGPFAYPVAHILANETTDARPQSDWPYKFDTTSIAMRAFAEFLHVSAWPRCLLYKTSCTQQLIETATIFRMLDSLVEAVANLKSPRTPNNLTLRTTNKFLDRIHHFILPTLFHTAIKRTSQVIYYDSKLLSAPGFAFCAFGAYRVRPYACADLWTNFTAICHETNPLCKGVGPLFEHAANRYRSLQQQHPKMIVDLVIFESHDDLNSAALTFQGRKAFDVVVVMRVRECNRISSSAHPTLQCSTVAIDDFRYEGDSFASNVNDWFAIIAVLRIVGQAYAWLRLGLLFAGCFVAASAEPRFADSSVLARTAAGLRKMLSIPSQVIVYSSLLPIMCYVVAHVLDSAMTYELVSQVFSTPLGVAKLKLGQFLQLSAVMMRNVWVMALALHIAALGATKLNTWTPSKGVVGVPEFAISFISCLTIMALFRSIEFRDSRVTSLSPVIQSDRLAALRKFSYDNTQSMWELLLHDNMLDAKCLVASAAVYMSLATLIWCCVWTTRRLRHAKLLSINLLLRSEVPYTADARRRLHHNVSMLDGRSSEAQALVYLMNLAMLTDPVTLLRVWWIQDHAICVLRSRTTDRLFLIPQTTLDSEQDIPIDWSDYEVVLRVGAKDLPWQDLVHCG